MYNQITNLDVSKNIKLTNLIINNIQISEIDIIECHELRQLWIFGTPAAYSTSAILSIANALPDRTGKDAGEIIIGNTELTALIQSICEAKNWIIK